MILSALGPEPTEATAAGHPEEEKDIGPEVKLPAARVWTPTSESMATSALICYVEVAFFQFLNGRGATREEVVIAKRDNAILAADDAPAHSIVFVPWTNQVTPWTAEGRRSEDEVMAYVSVPGTEDTGIVLSPPAEHDALMATRTKVEGLVPFWAVHAGPTRRDGAGNLEVYEVSVGLNCALKVNGDYFKAAQKKAQINVRFPVITNPKDIAKGDVLALSGGRPLKKARSSRE